MRTGPSRARRPSAFRKQLEKYPTAKVADIESALDEAAQQDLITAEHRLLTVEPPSWLHLPERRHAQVVAPKPKFEKSSTEGFGEGGGSMCPGRAWRMVRVAGVATDRPLMGSTGRR
jgi:hypothetical protein